MLSLVISFPLIDDAKVRRKSIPSKHFCGLCAQTHLILDLHQRNPRILDFNQNERFIAPIFGFSLVFSYLCGQIIIIRYMDNKTNKYIAVSYKLYVDGDNGKELIEEATAERPFSFLTGFGFALDKFEEQMIATEKGQDFKLTLSKEEGYGEYHEEYVLDLDRNMFCINGHFDHEHIYQDAIVPLQNEQGERFNGRVLEISEEKVKMDLNHPLAGETLYFEGTVLENREATKEEVDHMMKHLTGGCGGHCDSCGGGCDHDDCGCGHDDCGCGHDHEHEHHHDGCGCGHCH